MSMYADVPAYFIVGVVSAQVENQQRKVQACSNKIRNPFFYNIPKFGPG